MSVANTPEKIITSKIKFIRNQKVMLDKDLAELYGVSLKRLNEQVKRNLKRFPKDFMFQLKAAEYESLRSQFATLKRGRHSKYLPYVFTEQGVAMISSVLNSDRAIEVNIAIMRVFVRLRKVISENAELMRKINRIEQRLDKHDEEIQVVFDVIKRLMTIPTKKQKIIGF